MANRMLGSAGFLEDILVMFTPGDRACMENILPLASWRDVRRNAREILRRVRLPLSDSDHMPVGREWSADQIYTFAAWVNEDTPKKRGETYSGFFRDLDSMTEYFDVYGRDPAENLMPYVARYFGRDDVPGRRKALNHWREYAVIAEDDPEKAEQKQLLVDELSHADVDEAIRIVDRVLVDLIKFHWSIAGAPDLDLILDAFRRFGADRLPEDADRLSRIQALGDPGDFRLAYALFHRMDSLIMWMNWMGHVECAAMLYGPQDADHGVRAALLAALSLGYSADCVFRNRGQTRPEYYAADGEEQMWRKSARIANDFEKARLEAHALTRLRESRQTPDALAHDQPVRFRSLRPQ